MVIGGDHSLGLGSASGVGKCYDDFGIIWLDAHGDINTSETSPSGNIHGMPLSALMGMGSEELVNIYAPGNKVNPQNVFLVGIRNVHFSIDVDSIDPRFAPGTGTRVCEGLMPDEFNNFVDHMLSTNLIKSMDLVELNPELDVNEQTTSLCLQIIDYITARL